MTRTLNTPEPAGIAEKVTIDRFSVTLYRGPDLRLDTFSSDFSFVLHYRDADGNKVDSHIESIPLQRWPGPLRNALKDIRAMILAYAENENLLSADTDTNEFDAP